ncbi:uncharacterized protein LOC113383478 [Ctenocephalides felis]|uniref:uncharacterized protein LOC113383478 n=1 Tax=Ctenocephalides felis TaxID=7515 RepID=UPI000E6E2757|nr:uncharacterized protein LOC113383478 [Ctenocephalides felis]
MADKNLIVAWIFLIVSASLTDICQAAVRIKALRVPAVVQDGGVDSVLLDCDYELRNPYGLVVKWYFAPDGKMTMRPIYQWIADQKPHALGAFKNFVNLSYKASDDPNFRYRAMNLLKPTRNMSGTYQCVVETYYDGTAQESAKMLVYVPQSMLLLGQEKVDDDTIRVFCWAHGVYPSPIITMRIANK